jgi:hypothetical protein
VLIENRPQTLVAFGGLPETRPAFIIAMASIHHVAVQNQDVS